MDSKLDRRARAAIRVFALLLWGSVCACRGGPVNFPAPEPVYLADCNVAGYFVADLCTDEQNYLQWASRFPEYPDARSLSRIALKKVSDARGIDSAAALFYVRILQSQETTSLVRYVSQKEAVFRQSGLPHVQAGLRLVFIPGMFYVQNKDFDSEGRAIRRVAERMGYATDLIRVRESGSAQANAIQICTYLAEAYPARIVFATLSKGASDLKLATRHCGKEPYFGAVRGWFNVAGLLRGTPLVDNLEESWFRTLEARVYFAFRGFEYEGVRSLASRKGGLLDFDLELPRRTVLVNVMPIPIRRTVSTRAMPYYDELARLGPNDGLGLLSDMYEPRGVTFPVWRSDHYFSEGFPDERIAALLFYMAENVKD